MRSKILIILLMTTLFLSGCSHNLKSDIWDLEKESTAHGGIAFFPELHDSKVKLNIPKNKVSNETFGIAFSGGGTRAASAALGQLRVFRELGWWDKADYVSLISGGAWGVLPYLYFDEAIIQGVKAGEAEEAFLGKYLPPDAITDTNVSCSDKDPLLCNPLRFSKTIASAEVWNNAIEGWVNFKGNRTYAYVLSNIFLKPYKLDEKTFFTWDHTKQQQIVKINKEELSSINKAFDTSDIAVVRNNKGPFPVVGSTLMVERSGNFFDHYPIEITPYYIGIRNKSNYEHTYRDKNITENYNIKTREVTIGGGYIEPIAYGASFPTGGINSRQISVKLTSLDKAFGLADVMATTGAAPQYALHKYAKPIAHRIGFPEFNYWGIDKDCAKDDIEYSHGDGGHLDNLGIMPLLARHVDNILVLVNTQTPFEYDIVNGRYEIYDNIASLFELPGKNTTYKKVFTRYPHNVVFNAAKYRELVQAFASQKLNYPDRPLVYCDKYDVQANSFWDIRGTYKPNICWVYLDRNEKWIEQLTSAPKLQKQIQELRKPFEHFPTYWTFLENGIELIDYTEPMVNALAGIAGWSIMEDRDYIANALNLL